MKKVAIVGLGYVGLPLAHRATAAGYLVSGVDSSDKVINHLGHTEAVFSSLSNSYNSVKMVDIVVVCVPTPIHEDKSPDLSHINSALMQVGKRLHKGQLVSIESTVFPGYCATTGRHILESESGLVAGSDFYLVHCPERVNPGDSVWHVGNIPRVLGAVNEESAVVGKRFYADITDGGVFVTRNMDEAEAAKMVENTFRDINIAFVNELAKSFDGTNVSLVSVIDAASTKPFGYMPFRPGLGVGGHCIPVDPEYLIDAARARGFRHDLIINARKVNDSMVDFVVNKIQKSASGSVVALLGLTYKPGVADLRESQAMRLRNALVEKGYSVIAYDPLVESDVENVEDALAGAETVVIATAHEEFSGIEERINNFSSITLVFDAGRSVRPALLKKAKYMGIGV